MKKKYASGLCMLILVGIVLVASLGYRYSNIPPSVTDVQNLYQEYSSDIHTVINFLSASDYEDVYITDTNGTMLADLNKIQIQDPAVLDSLNRIFDNKAYHHINKDGNTISFLQWKGTRDIGCGIAYTITKVDVPQIEFITELIPLSDEYLFYYVSDYATWRNSQK